jgi:hypothetical protein
MAAAQTLHPPQALEAVAPTQAAELRSLLHQFLQVLPGLRIQAKLPE